MEFTLKPSAAPGGPPQMMTCPKCGFEQPENPDCAKCGIVIARYKPSQATPAYTPPPPEKSKEQQAIDRMKAITPPPSGPGLFSQLFRITRWALVLGCLGALVMMLRQAPPPTVAVDPEGAQKVSDKFLAAKEAATQGQSFAMPLTEAELNAWIGANLAGSGGTPTQEQAQSSMKDIRLHLAGDQIHAYTRFTLYGKEVSLQLTGKLQVKDGRLRMEATQGIFGTLPLPHAALGSAVSVLFDSPTNREKFVLPTQIANVQVQNGELLISYKGQTP